MGQPVGASLLAPVKSLLGSLLIRMADRAIAAPKTSLLYFGTIQCATSGAAQEAAHGIPGFGRHWTDCELLILPSGGVG
jgi:hypothetical protein